MVTDTERQNAFVYSESWRVKMKFRRFLVDRFYCELFVVERNISNFAPREPDLRCQPVNKNKVNKQTNKQTTNLSLCS